MEIEIKINDNESAILSYPLTPSTDIVQPSEKNNLIQLELIPSNITSPRYLPSQAALSTYNDNLTTTIISPNYFEPMTMPVPHTSDISESDTLMADEITEASTDSFDKIFEDMQQRYEDRVTSALVAAIKNHDDIKECNINLTLKNFNGTTTNLSQNALLSLSENPDAIQLNTTSIITQGSDNCSQFISKSLSEIDSEKYLDAVFVRIFNSMKTEEQ